MAIGFAVDPDLRILGSVDLSLSVEDSQECMLECSNEAVMLGIISTPCGCPQPLCLFHYEREKPRWFYRDPIACYLCGAGSEEDIGEFLRWEKL